MSSLLEGIDTTHVGEKKPGGGGADSSGEGKSNAKKLAFAVLVLLLAVAVIVWNTTTGPKPGEVIRDSKPAAVATPVAKPSAPVVGTQPKQTNTDPAANIDLRIPLSPSR